MSILSLATGHPVDMTRSVGKVEGGWHAVDVPEFPWVISVKLGTVGTREMVVGLKLEPRYVPGVKVADYEVTARALRNLPLGRIKALVDDARSGDLSKLARSLKRIDRKPGEPWPEEHYLQVAAVYMAAEAAGEPPVKAVMREWIVSRASASVYVAEARKRGYLGYPSRPGVSGSSESESPIKGGDEKQ